MLQKRFPVFLFSLLLLSAVALLSALPADAQCTNCGVIPGSPAEVALVGTTTNLRIGETVDESFDGDWAAIGMPGFGTSPFEAGQVQLYMRDSFFSTTSWTRTNTLSLSDFGITPVANDSFGWSARIGGNDFLAVTSPGPYHQRVFFYQRTGSTWAPFPKYLDTNPTNTNPPDPNFPNPNPPDPRAVQLNLGLGTASAPMCSTGSGVARIALQGLGIVAIYDIDVAGGTIYPPTIISQSGILPAGAANGSQIGNANGDLAFDTDCQTLVVGGNGGSLFVFRASNSSPHPSWTQTQQLPAPATQNTASENNFGLSVVPIGSIQLFTRPLDLWADWLVVGYPDGDCPGQTGIPPLAGSGIVLAYFRNSISHQYSHFQTICSSGQFSNGRFGESVGISNGQLLGLLPGTGASFGALYSFKFYDSSWQQNLGAVTSTMDALASTGHPPPSAASISSLVIRRDSIIYASPYATGVNGHPNAGALDIKFSGCGDGVVESFQGTPFEACDSGGVDTASCNSSCTVPFCGDSYTNKAAGEECDDGPLNGTSGDGCSATCTLKPTELNTSLSTMNAAANYGNSSVTLSAAVTNTTNSIAINEGMVTFTVNGSSVASGTVTGGTATASFPLGTSVNAGTYPIAASFGPSTQFNASSTTGSPGTLTVNQDSASITVSNASAVYGAANVTLNATVSNTTNSVAVNGGTVMFTVNGTSVTSGTVSNGAASATFTLGPGANAGSYSITASYSGSTDFTASATVSPATLTITPAPLVIAANNATRQYGAADPAFTVSYSGFVNGDTQNTPGVLTGTLTFTSTDMPASPVGIYSINCSGLSSPNYSISNVPGTLAITPAPLSVVANNATRPYGANNPAISPAVVGLLNLDPITAADTIGATPASPVGTYPITAVLSDPQNRLGNYAVALVPGTLLIVPESTSLTVTFSPLSMMVGQSTTATVTLTAPDMVIPIDPSVLAPFTLTSPVASDILSNGGVCAPVPGAAPGLASCAVNVTSVEPNGRTINANFAGSANLAGSTGAGDLMVTAALLSQQVCLASDFRNVAVPGGSNIWLNSIFRLRDVTKQLVHVSFFNSSVQFQYTDPAGNIITVNQHVPDADITMDPNATMASTVFDPVNNVWVTKLPWDLDDNAFLTGLPWLIPSAGLPADVEPVTWCGTFASDVPNIDIAWRWAASAYSTFSSDNTTLGVKPMDTDHDNQATNHDRAGTPENYKQFVIPGARGKGGKNYTGTYSKSAVIE